ncbi:troponin T, skeletal muscle-like isoform X1 [Leptopilina boulardi]|uniref:troponin T, skeletal muscle-like isoform X1 n=1 Tax=Leptopilina boulardi TaxID=63433 RepID=UPI0021F50E09|nr:troponin T, skeletal muscle-like isoform X1 [Leptopilina boulardi]XP_051157177.1 troponin T, skeletal muscle-like isoform X1 [Leptopilina boulardi]
MDDINLFLIKLIKKEPVIFDKSSNYYKDVTRKREAWERIVKQFNDNTGCNVTVKQAQGRCRILKENYSKERAAFKQHTPSGSAAQRGPEWIYLNDMSFMEPIAEHMFTVESFGGAYSAVEEEREEEEEEEEEMEEEEDETENEGGNIFFYLIQASDYTFFSTL